jgi:hypothetical protein
VNDENDRIQIRNTGLVYVTVVISFSVAVFGACFIADKIRENNRTGSSSENGKTSAEISPVCVELGDNV